MLPDISGMITREQRRKMTVVFLLENRLSSFYVVGIDEVTGKTCVCFVSESEDGKRFMGTLFTKQTILDVVALKGRNLDYYAITGKFSKKSVTGNSGETYYPIIGKIEGI